MSETCYRTFLGMVKLVTGEEAGQLGLLECHSEMAVNNKARTLNSEPNKTGCVARIKRYQHKDEA